MHVGVIVWCLINVTLKTSTGQMEYGYETAAKGRITKIEGENLYVDFSKYAREQEYVGSYYNIKVSEGKCTSE